MRSFQIWEKQTKFNYTSCLFLKTLCQLCHALYLIIWYSSVWKQSTIKDAANACTAYVFSHSLRECSFVPIPACSSLDNAVWRAVYAVNSSPALFLPIPRNSGMPAVCMNSLLKRASAHTYVYIYSKNKTIIYIYLL